MSDESSTGYQYYPSLMGHGPNCYPLQGAALVWSGYMTTYDTLYTTTDDFWLGEVFELTDNKVKFTVALKNAEPWVVCPPIVDFLPDEDIKLPIELWDQGSDDLYCTLDWGDGDATGLMIFYNNGDSPEPIYMPTHSALSGIAPFMVDPNLYHRYLLPGDYYINVTLCDDDMRAHEEECVKTTIIARVLTSKQIKEKAVELLESVLPGRDGWVGYKTLTIKYLGVEDPTVLVYNHISRPPYYWETELFMSFCNVKQNDILFINGTYLDEGMFGSKLILKLYTDSQGVLDVSEIPTVYTCLDPLKIGQRYGLYEIINFSKQAGISYHHYSKFALKTEDALDHVLRSINRDPRRGYGWWHEYWAWWCGYTYYRGLWVDEMRLDPQFGLVVFCEERAAALDLMEVLKNCLDPQGVLSITFQYTGKAKVDIEIYILKDWWYGYGGWEWYDAYYDTVWGESFTIDGSEMSGGMLPERLMFRIYHATTGKLLDTIYIRTSGEWFLEVEPGNIYGDLNITDSTLILGDETEWDTWWGGDTAWWDWFFGFWYWEEEKFRSCGWEVDECYDAEAAAEEQQRICGNLTILKQVINMLVKADDMLARIAYSDAENVSVMNASYEDEYMYHMKWSKRYWYRGYDNYKKGRPHRAINDFKQAWKYGVIALKWAIKNPGDPIPGSDMDDPCSEGMDHGDCEVNESCHTSEYEMPVKHPWWMYWYVSWCTCKHFQQYRCDHCGNWCYC